MMSDKNDTVNAKPTVTVYIDQQAYQVSPDDNLLAGVLSQKLNLPYFCWHPSMGSVGACRQCAVTQYQDENDTRGRLVMACTTPVTDGMRISLKDNSSVEFREQIIAAMMTNHPHDCPVCAEGGECHLQDMTVMTGHSSRQYKGEKRTFTNQHLGEFVGHEMNRCITCYRCVRFYKDYAGGEDFGVYGSKNQVYFGRQIHGQLESEFSGNLVEVCPTGVFTNKLFSAHYTRKWDLQSAPSVCAHCAIGCNTSVGERYGSVRRVMNRFNHDINGYFLCDRGRFGIGFVNADSRIRQTKGINQQSPVKLTKLDVAKALVHYKGQRFIGIGSARASYEANFYLQKLVGKENFSLGLNNNEMYMAAIHRQYLAEQTPASLAEIEQSDFVLIIDEDITQTAPRMALSVRQALRNVSIDKAALLGIPSWQDSAVRTIGGQSLTPLYILQSHGSKLDTVAEQVILQTTDAIVSVLETMAALVGNQAELTDVASEYSVLLNKLLQAKNPLIIGGWSRKSPALLKTVCNFIRVINSKNSNLKSALIPSQANSLGLLSLMDEETLSVEQVCELTEKTNEVKAVDGILLLEQECASFTAEQLTQLQRANRTIIALEHSENKATEIANIVLPAAAVTEGDGHFVNYQGRIQAFYQVHPSVLPIQESWRWLGLIAKSIFPDHPLAKESRSLTELHRLFLHVDPSWEINMNDSERQTVRETHRSSGRTAKMANISVHESKTTQSFDPYRFSMEGGSVSSKGEMPFSWAPGWNSNQSIHQYQQHVGGELSNASSIECIDFSKVNAQEQLVVKWQTIHSDVIKSEQGQQSYYQLTPWYLGEWQASLTPEFQLLDHVNSIAMSAEMANKHQWRSGQWVCVSSVNSSIKNSADNEQQQTLHSLAQVFVDARLKGNFIYGDIDNFINNDVNNVQLSHATDEQIQAYQTSCAEKKQQAKNHQQHILARLKQQDQHIPIRLVMGGLDDV